MIAELTSYPSMKDSGAEFIGKVPEHWEVNTLRRSLRPYDGIKIGPFGSQLKLDEMTASGNKVYGQANVIRNDFAYGKKFIDDEKFENLRVCEIRPGDLLLTMMGTSGRCAQVPKDVNRGINSAIVKDLVLALPPRNEQASIVRYLDHVDRRVVLLVQRKRKLIALLTEQKEAIIHRAVTRGLNPNVGMKDSGLEWLGEVPKHWDIRRNGRLFAQRNETGFPELPVFEVSLRTGIRIRDFENSERKQVMSDRAKYKRAVSGDVAYNMMRMWQGAVGVAPTDGLISPAYVVAQPLPGTDGRYFVKLFRTTVYKQEVDNYSRGIVKDRNRLYWEDFKAMPSCYPPPDEQGAIVEYIEKISSEIETAIDRAVREIELLNEYRSRLIADVVTGKLDVRDVAATLPDIDPLEFEIQMCQAANPVMQDDIDVIPEQADE